MAYYIDSAGNIDHASPGLLKPGELKKRNCRLLSDAEAKRLIARGQIVRLPADQEAGAEVTAADVAAIEAAENGESEATGDEGIGAQAQAQFEEVSATIDALGDDKAAKDQLEEIGREYEIELDKRKGAATLKEQLKRSIADALGVVVEG